MVAKQAKTLRAGKQPAKFHRDGNGSPQLAATGVAVPATAFLDYRTWLNVLHATIKAARHGHYSWLEMASEFGLPKTNVLHLAAKGKRPLSAKSAAKIAAALKLSARERDFLQLLVAWQNTKEPRTRELLFDQILKQKRTAVASDSARARLDYFSAWYHPVIREMTFLPDFCSDPDWIARTIWPRIRPEQARRSLDLLESLGMLRFDTNAGRHVAVTTDVSTGNEVDSVLESLAVIRYHHETIALGRDSIATMSEDERDISAVTVCVSAATAEAMKSEVAALRKRLLALAASDAEGDRIMQFNAQLFPVAKTAAAESKHDGNQADAKIEEESA